MPFSFIACERRRMFIAAPHTPGTPGTRAMLFHQCPLRRLGILRGKATGSDDEGSTEPSRTRNMLGPMTRADLGLSLADGFPVIRVQPTQIPIEINSIRFSETEHAAPIFARSDFLPSQISRPVSQIRRLGGRLNPSFAIVQLTAELPRR